MNKTAKSFHQTSVGKLEATWEESTGGKWQLTRLDLETEKAKRGDEQIKEIEKEAKKLQESLEKFFSGQEVDWAKEIDYELKGGTELQRAVWREIEKVGFGKKTYYSLIAEKVGKPKATRAVGSAVGKNPLPIIVGCHRVLAKGGGIGGFSWGLTAKRKLLALEG